MSAHTPGPWSLTRGVVGVDGHAIAVVIGPMESFDDQSVKDAALLVAAPELYEALRVLLIEIGEGGPNGRAIDLLSKQTVNNARAAIAKARGES